MHASEYCVNRHVICFFFLNWGVDHTWCISPNKLESDPKGNWFCSEGCKKVPPSLFGSFGIYFCAFQLD